jgi:hypothetical protein
VLESNIHDERKMSGAESGAGAANFDPVAHQAVVDRDSQEEVDSEPGLGVERTKASLRVPEPGASQHLPAGGRPQRGVEITHHDERAWCVCHFGAEVLKELFIVPRKAFLAVGFPRIGMGGVEIEAPLEGESHITALLADGAQFVINDRDAAEDLEALDRKAEVMGEFTLERFERGGPIPGRFEEDGDIGLLSR